MKEADEALAAVQGSIPSRKAPVAARLLCLISCL